MSAIGRYRPFQPHKYPKTVRFNAYSVHISASTVAGGCDGSFNRFFCVVLISSDAETTVPAHSSGNKAAISLEFWWSETVHVFVIYQRVLCRWTILPVLTLQLSECEVEVRLQSGEWTI